jgi:hypothetical protein
MAGTAILLTVTLMLLSVFKSNAQTVNFSGTWALNEAKSSPVEGGFRFAPTKLVITHSGNDLSVQRTSQGPNGEFTSNDKFTLDGKECTNTLFGNNTRKSVVKWSSDDKTLTFSHSMTFERDGQSMTFNSTENWKLNEADKTLAIETVMNTPNGEMRVTNVYDKK